MVGEAVALLQVLVLTASLSPSMCAKLTFWKSLLRSSTSRCRPGFSTSLTNTTTTMPPRLTPRPRSSAAGWCVFAACYSLTLLDVAWS